MATIVQAVRQGHLAYRNMKKLTLYLLTTGLSELIVLFGALFPQTCDIVPRPLRETKETLTIPCRKFRLLSEADSI